LIPLLLYSDLHLQLTSTLVSTGHTSSLNPTMYLAGGRLSHGWLSHFRMKLPRAISLGVSSVSLYAVSVPKIQQKG